MILPIRRVSKVSDDMASFSRSCCWVSYTDSSASCLDIVTMNMFSGDNVERRCETGNHVLVVPTRHPCLMIAYWSRLNATWLVHQALGNVPAVGWNPIWQIDWTVTVTVGKERDDWLMGISFWSSVQAPVAPRHWQNGCSHLCGKGQ